MSSIEESSASTDFGSSDQSTSSTDSLPGIDDSSSDSHFSGEELDASDHNRDLLSWIYHKKSKNIEGIVKIQQLLDKRFSRAAQLFVATKVRDALLKAQDKSTLGNRKIHWKDAVKLLLYQIASGKNFGKIAKKGIAHSTLHKVIAWILPFVCITF